MAPSLFYRSLALFLLLAGLAAHRGGSADVPRAGARLPVVATFSILGEAVAKVGGDRVAIATLVGRGGDPHTYEPTPTDARRYANSALVFMIGLHLEPWLSKLQQATGNRVPRVVVTTGINPRVVQAEDDDGEPAPGAFSREKDPHVWQNPQNMVVVVRNIEQALSQADPAGAGVYRVNAAAYQAELMELDRYLLEQTATIPPARRVLATSHDSLGYFADRYGFMVPLSSLTSPSTVAGEPTAAQVKAAATQLRRFRAPAVFTENVGNARVIEAIAKEARVRVDVTLYTDALGPAGSPGETYLKMMRHNIDAIVKALRL